MSTERNSNDAKKKLQTWLGNEMKSQIDQLSDNDANVLTDLIGKPGLRVRADKSTVPYGISVRTGYGVIRLDSSLTSVSNVFINGAKFSVQDASLTGLETLLSEEATNNLVPEGYGSARRTRGRRTGRRAEVETPFEDVQKHAYEDLNHVKLTYETLFLELGSILGDNSYGIDDVMNELLANKVSEDDIARFITHDSEYHRQIVGQLYGVNYGDMRSYYTFEPLTKGEHLFADKVIDMLGVDSAEYDAKFGVLKIGDRLITNLPEMDDKGVFSNRNTKYIPYHIGYFANEEGSRVSRLRHIDPVDEALKAVKLQYELSPGDIKFQTLLDVSRNLPDFDNHPYGEAILDTYKRKIVLDKNYLKTNSLLAEYQNKADDLGAVALTMLDDDAKGLIDPYGTSNGGNMGVIFYLTKDAQFNQDGTLSHGESEHSMVGDIMNEFQVDRDNFNRNQMSFNAFLTSVDVQKLNVAYSEFALWNSEDALVMTKSGAEKYGEAKATGDKMTDWHGNKSTISLIIDPDMDNETAKNERLEHAVEFAKLNPDLDMIVSPISLASRLNMGVAHEGLVGARKDLNLPNGDVVKGGIVEIAYMSLPQTAEHKSKDYGQEGTGRKYSTLFRHALSSKVGDELYRKGLVSEDVRAYHIDEIATAFERQGVTFKNEEDLIQRGNIQTFVDSPVTVSAEDFSFKTPAVVRLSLMNQMQDNRINIDLGDMQLKSPMTGQVMQDSNGNNILPIRVVGDEGIPYRYTEVFKALALGNEKGLQTAYDKAVSVDYKDLTKKNNLLKNIDTMTFFEGAKTEMIIPDPRIGLGDIRTSVNSDRVIGHRDPAIQSGNTISFRNVGGNAENMTHVNPLMINQVDGDFDSDTMGINGYQNLTLSDAEKDEFFAKSSVEEQLNKYGEVFLTTGGSHFKAGILANGLDDSNVTFEDGKSNRELREIVEDLNAKIVDSPASYGAYALSFENEQSLQNSLGRLADDGIKGNREDMSRHFEHGYTVDENRAVMKALIAKSEWTGLAGAITNDLIAGFGANEFDADLTRVSMDVTHSMTQSVLQMKKNAERLPEIDNKIAQMKTVMSGKYGVEESREKLHEITDGLVSPKAVDKFVDLVSEKQSGPKFGQGVFNHQDLSTNKAAYISSAGFSKGVMRLAEDNPQQSAYPEMLSEAELNDIMKEFESNYMQ